VGGGGLEELRLVIVLDRVSDDSLLMEMASLRSRVKLACWVEVASRKAWVTMRFEEILVESETLR